MVKIDFAMIDGRDNLPVGINLIDIERGRPANTHNAKVIVDAEVEYLNRLLDLQREIKAKYEPQLIENVPVDGEPKGYDKGSPSNIREKELRAKAKKATDVLWYS